MEKNTTKPVNATHITIAIAMPKIFFELFLIPLLDISFVSAQPFELTTAIVDHKLCLKAVVQPFAWTTVVVDRGLCLKAKKLEAAQPFALTTAVADCGLCLKTENSKLQLFLLQIRHCLLHPFQTLMVVFGGGAVGGGGIQHPAHVLLCRFCFYLMAELHPIFLFAFGDSSINQY